MSVDPMIQGVGRGLSPYAYCGNNPLRYVDPNGLWIKNPNGTCTAEKGDTLYGLYGKDWKEKSGYEGDPTKMPIGTTVGKSNDSGGSSSNSNGSSNKGIVTNKNNNIKNALNTYRQFSNQLAEALETTSTNMNIAGVAVTVAAIPFAELGPEVFAPGEAIALVSAGYDLTAEVLYLTNIGCDIANMDFDNGISDFIDALFMAPTIALDACLDASVGVKPAFKTWRLYLKSNGQYASKSIKTALLASKEFITISIYGKTSSFIKSKINKD